jgi:hypothetical protein
MAAYGRKMQFDKHLETVCVCVKVTVQNHVSVVVRSLCEEKFQQMGEDN